MSSEFCPAIGHLHILDSEHVSHLCNRHADIDSKSPKRRYPISLAEIEMIPQIVLPKNIAEFSKKGRSPRIIYRREVTGGTLVAVEEVRHGRGHAVLKTLYRQK